MRIREGCRGGQEQFRWNQVKDQDFKDREQYLGQSTKVGTMGKFGRYYQHDWYAKKRDTAESIDEEKAAVQAYEEELMQEALGLKPKNLLLAKRQLTPEELKEFLSKDKPEGKRGRDVMGPQKKIIKNEFGEQVMEGVDGCVEEAARDAPIKGIGFASHRTAKLEEQKAQIIGTVGKLEGSKFSAVKMEVKSEVKGEPQEDSLVVKPEVKEEIPETDHRERRMEVESSEERRQRKVEKKEKKRKKAEKKEKKARKVLKKAKKAADAAKRRMAEVKKVSRRSSSRGRSSSSSS